MDGWWSVSHSDVRQTGVVYKRVSQRAGIHGVAGGVFRDGGSGVCDVVCMESEGHREEEEDHN